MSSLARTLSAVRPLIGADRLVHGAPPAAEPGWTSLAQLADPERARREVHRLVAGSAAGDPGAAGAFLAIYVALCVVGPLAVAGVGQRRGWELRPDRVWLRGAASGGFDAVAMEDVPVLVVRGDAGPDAASGDVVTCSDRDDLEHRVAASVVAAFTGVFAAIRVSCRYGVGGMWGQLADEVYSYSLATARAHDLDHHEAWAAADRLVDRIAARVSVLRVRSHPVADPARPGTQLLAVKGTCCLIYRTGDDTSLAATCSQCPRRLGRARRT